MILVLFPDWFSVFFSPKQNLWMHKTDTWTNKMGSLMFFLMYFWCNGKTQCYCVVAYFRLLRNLLNNIISSNNCKPTFPVVIHAFHFAVAHSNSVTCRFLSMNWMFQVCHSISVEFKCGFQNCLVFKAFWGLTHVNMFQIIVLLHEPAVLQLQSEAFSWRTES